MTEQMAPKNIEAAEFRPTPEQTEEQVLIGFREQKRKLLNRFIGTPRFSEMDERLTQMISAIEAKHQDARQYRLYHELIGSSELPPMFDFPGEDSIARQMADLYVKYFGTKKAA